MPSEASEKTAQALLAAVGGTTTPDLNARGVARETTLQAVLAAIQTGGSSSVALVDNGDGTFTIGTP